MEAAHPERLKSCHIFALFSDQLAMDREAVWLLTMVGRLSSMEQESGAWAPPLPQKVSGHLEPLCLCPQGPAVSPPSLPLFLPSQDKIGPCDPGVLSSLLESQHCMNLQAQLP